MDFLCIQLIMNDDNPSSAAPERRPRKKSSSSSVGAEQQDVQKSWLDRLSQALLAEPKDREDLIQLLRDSEQRDILDGDAVAMIEGVLAVSEMQVRDVMIPRSQMVVVERDDSMVEFLPTIIESAHSRFPVIGDNRDEVIGILLAKDLLPFATACDFDGFNIRELLRPVLIIPESKRLNVLLKEFRASRNHMAIVVDEYGGVAGLVTIEDVLEQIVGEIEDEHDFDADESNILDIGNGEYTVRALTPVEDFNEELAVSFSDEEFDTIGGVVMGALGHLPKRDETLELEGFSFRVLRADNRRIHLLRVRRIGPNEDAFDELLTDGC